MGAPATDNSQSPATHSDVKPGKVILQLPDNVGLADVTPVLDKLRAGPMHVVMDAAQVVSAPLTVLQALVVIAQHQAQVQCRFEIRAPSGALLAVARGFGFHSVLWPQEAT